MQNADIHNEQLSAAAFSKQSAIFDHIYAEDVIVHYKRQRVRSHINRFLAPHSNILELNAGTGEDAIYFAQLSHHVHATDISEGMLGELTKKVKNLGLENKVSIEQCSYTALDTLKNKGPYNMVFSNFAGLNCTGDLKLVLQSLASILAPEGIVTLVVLPPFCLWETLMLFKGKFKTAFRRINRKNGVDAKVEGLPFKCWYYKPSFIIDTLKNDYTLLGLEGLCTIVPPSYIEHFAEKYPRLYKQLTKVEDKLKSQWPWKFIGDYYIITLQKK